MKTLLTFAVAALLVGSCKKDEPTPENTPPVNTPEEYQELYSEYVQYECPNNQLVYTSAKTYVTPQGNTDSKISLKNNKIYSVYGTTENELGKYTSSYILFNSNSSDTLFIVSKTSTEMIAQPKHPVPCFSHTTIRYTFQQ